MKNYAIFYFTDEPQFVSENSRAWAANYLRACRSSRGNRGMRRYTVKRTAFGRYTVQLNTLGSPVAVITTNGDKV